jgi:hypothetical protein
LGQQNTAGYGQAPLGPNGQPLLNQQGGNNSPLGFGSQNGMMGQMTPNGEQVPYFPLLLVSLAFAGSLGANLFLGWSYADARYRYRLLVLKSSESFHKAASLAA